MFVVAVVILYPSSNVSITYKIVLKRKSRFIGCSLLALDLFWDYITEIYQNIGFFCINGLEKCSIDVYWRCTCSKCVAYRNISRGGWFCVIRLMLSELCLVLLAESLRPLSLNHRFYWDWETEYEEKKSNTGKEWMKERWVWTPRLHVLKKKVMSRKERKKEKVRAWAARCLKMEGGDGRPLGPRLTVATLCVFRWWDVLGHLQDHRVWERDDDRSRGKGNFFFLDVWRL